jgi:hypothetical protein
MKSLGHCPVCGKDADYVDGAFQRCHNWPSAHSPENVADMARPTTDERLHWEFMKLLYGKGFWSGTADRHSYSD